jgi:Ca2+-binding EF-hand superfamily protein
MIPIHRSLAGLSACGAMAMLAGCSASDPFAKLDTNRDNSGSCDEFRAYMKQEVFTRVDADGNGSVTLAEWQAVNPKVDKDKARFDKADRNRDGSISRSEADAAFDREGSLTKLFAKIDANGDGSLSRDEVSAFREKVRQQPGATPVEKISKASRS